MNLTHLITFLTERSPTERTKESNDCLFIFAPHSQFQTLPLPHPQHHNQATFSTSTCPGNRIPSTDRQTPMPLLVPEPELADKRKSVGGGKGTIRSEVKKKERRKKGGGLLYPGLEGLLEDTSSPPPLWITWHSFFTLVLFSSERVAAQDLFSNFYCVEFFFISSSPPSVEKSSSDSVSLMTPTEKIRFLLNFAFRMSNKMDLGFLFLIGFRSRSFTMGILCHRVSLFQDWRRIYTGKEMMGFLFF